MTETRERKTRLPAVARAVWKDGWVAAWLFVSGFNLAMGFFHLNSLWMQGAFFGGTIGLCGGYMVTVHRNYRRTKREDIEFQLRQLKKLELRIVARPHPLREEMLDDIRDGRQQLEHALGELR